MLFIVSERESVGGSHKRRGSAAYSVTIRQALWSLSVFSLQFCKQVPEIVYIYIYT